MKTLVQPERVRDRKALATYTADIRSLACVLAHVCLEPLLAHEAFRALSAGERTVKAATVRRLRMRVQCRLSRELLVALVTGEPLLKVSVRA